MGDLIIRLIEGVRTTMNENLSIVHFQSVKKVFSQDEQVFSFRRYIYITYKTSLFHLPTVMASYSIKRI